MAHSTPEPARPSGPAPDAPPGVTRAAGAAPAVAPNAAPIIEARDLRHRFGKKGKIVEALRGIDLSVSPGEVFGFLGPNGAGKTTSIRILTGQLTPMGGEARVAGCDVVRDRRTLHRRIGVVFDVPNLYDAMTGRQNLRFFASLHGSPRDRIPRILEEVGLTEAADRRFRTYSKGMKQRLSLARALVCEPQVLFLDEPTSGLDPASALAVRELIARVSGQGITVFLTTHLMELADQVCHRLAILHAGQVVALGSPADLKAAHGTRELVLCLTDGEKILLPLGDVDTPARAAELLARKDLLRVDTREPTLEEVFLRLTGSELK